LLYRCSRFSDLGMCSNVSEAVNFHVYDYPLATREDIDEFSEGLRELYFLFDDEEEYCSRDAALRFICNFVLIPCDLHTGNPRLTCSSMCDYIVERCNSTFEMVNRLTSAVNYAMAINCTNPQQLLQRFEHSSLITSQ